MQLCEEFYKNDFQPWAVRVNAREHVFLYISKFGTNKLPQIYAQRQTVGSPKRVRIGHVAGGDERGRGWERRDVEGRVSRGRLDDDLALRRIVARRGEPRRRRAYEASIFLDISSASLYICMYFFGLFVRFA